MLENGSYKLRSLEAGMLVVEKVNPITQFCFATEIRGLARPISGNKEKSQKIEEQGQVLTNGKAP